MVEGAIEPSIVGMPRPLAWDGALLGHVYGVGGVPTAGASDRPGNSLCREHAAASVRAEGTDHMAPTSNVLRKTQKVRA
jgi:hypothetical protein